MKQTEFEASDKGGDVWTWESWRARPVWADTFLVRSQGQLRERLRRRVSHAIATCNTAAAPKSDPRRNHYGVDGLGFRDEGRQTIRLWIELFDGVFRPAERLRF